MGKWLKSSQELIERFHKSLEGVEDIQKRKMFGYDCSFYKDHMFTGLHEENWILRLSPNDKEEILQLGAKPFAPMGSEMKEYVLLPQSIMGNREELKSWIEKSMAFVAEKPPKKKRAKKSSLRRRS